MRSGSGKRFKRCRVCGRWLALGLSAILIVAITGLWVRSHLRTDSWQWRHTDPIDDSIEPFRDVMWHVEQRQGGIHIVGADIQAASRERTSHPTSKSQDLEDAVNRLQRQLHVLTNDLALLRVQEQRTRLVSRGWLSLMSNFRFQYSKTNDQRFMRVDCPHWFLLLAAGVPWLFATPGIIRRGRVRRRLRRGRCVKCGYDRAGLAKDAACPECGAV